jgi:hypothetical protein
VREPLRHRVFDFFYFIHYRQQPQCSEPCEFMKAVFRIPVKVYRNGNL